MALVMCGIDMQHEDAYLGYVVQLYHSHLNPVLDIEYTVG